MGTTTGNGNGKRTVTEQRAKVGNYHLYLHYSGEGFESDYTVNSVEYYRDVVARDWVESNYDTSKLTDGEIDLLVNAIASFASEIDLTDEQREYYDELAKDEYASNAGVRYGYGGWEAID